MTFESFGGSQHPRAAVDVPSLAPVCRRKVQRNIGLRTALVASSFTVALAGSAELNEAIEKFNGPPRETVTADAVRSSDAPAPPASLLELAAPPRPRPRPPSPTGARANGLNGSRAADAAEETAAAEAPAARGQEMAAVPPPTASAERLLGLTESSVEIWLGPPQQRLDAAPARVMRYVENGCHLDAFLYLDMQTKEFHVLHYEVATNDSSDQRK